MSNAVKEFYRGRKDPKKRALFDYDQDGNLIEKDKGGTTIHTHALPTYRAPTLEEFKEIDEARTTAIAEATDAFQAARLELHQAYQTHASPLTLLEWNKRVQEAELALNQARFPLQCVIKESGVVIRELDFTQPTEIRKYTYPISMLRHSPYPLQQYYVRAQESEAKPLISLFEVKAAKKAVHPVILFSDAEYATKPYGFLSLNYPVQLQIEDVTYPSARHALWALVATDLNDREHRDVIVQTPKAEDLVYSVRDTPGGQELNQEKWNRSIPKWLPLITKAKFEQNPELALRLEQTHPATLGAYEPNDNLIGMGIALDREASKEVKEWTGQNVLGKALMEVRDTIRSTRPAPSPLQDKVRSRKPRIRKAVVEEPVHEGAPIIPFPPLVPSAARLKSRPVLPKAEPKAEPMAIAEPMAEPKVEPMAEPKVEPKAKAEPSKVVMAQVVEKPMAPSAPIRAQLVEEPAAAPSGTLLQRAASKLRIPRAAALAAPAIASANETAAITASKIAPAARAAAPSRLPRRPGFATSLAKGEVL